MRRMRWLMCALVVVGLTESAAAADLAPVLRGSTYDAGPSERWDGVYVGAQFGTMISGADFNGATSGLSSLLQMGFINTPTATPLGATDHSGGLQYGGFVGYNTVWDGAVLGVEANYTHLNTTVSSTNAMVGTYVSADGVTTNPYSATGNASVHLTDYGTLKIRGGWAAGMFMPYVAVGVAVAQADFNRSVSATFTPPASAPGFVFPPTFAPLTLNTTISGLTYGYSLGAGVDVLLTNCLFLRAEYEYASFADFQQVSVHFHNLRVAAAYKF